jgi:hypothetical protein
MGFWLEVDEGEGDKFIFEICDWRFWGQPVSREVEQDACSLYWEQNTQSINKHDNYENQQNPFHFDGP